MFPLTLGSLASGVSTYLYFYRRRFSNVGEAIFGIATTFLLNNVGFTSLEWIKDVWSQSVFIWKLFTYLRFLFRNRIQGKAKYNLKMKTFILESCFQYSYMCMCSICDTKATLFIYFNHNIEKSKTILYYNTPIAQ